MNDRKAPKAQNTLDLASEAWNNIPWRKLEKHCFRIQKRIFRASQQGNHRAVQKLQKLLLKSKAAQTLAVRRVTQDNQGKKTAGIDGIKSLQPAERLRLVEQIAPKNWPKKSPPVRRIYIPKPGKNERRPLGMPIWAAHYPSFQAIFGIPWAILLVDRSYRSTVIIILYHTLINSSSASLFPLPLDWLAQGCNDLRSERNPTWTQRSGANTLQAACFAPLGNGRNVHIEQFGCCPRRVPSISPLSGWCGFRTLWTSCWDVIGVANPLDLADGKRASHPSSLSFFIEHGCNLGIRLRCRQPPHAVDHLWAGLAFFPRHFVAWDSKLGEGLCLPTNSHIDDVTSLGERHILDQPAHQLLALSKGCGGSMPDGWQVVRKITDLLALRGCEREGRLFGQQGIFSLQFLDLSQFLIPLSFQAPSHQAIVRVYGLVPSASQVGFILSSLNLAMPLLIRLLGTRFHLIKCRERHLQMSRLDGFQKRLFHGLVYTISSHGLTGFPGELRMNLMTFIHQQRAIALIPNAHASATGATQDDSLQERRALTNDSSMLFGTPGAVVIELALVAQKVVPGDVARMRIEEHNGPLFLFDPARSPFDARLFSRKGLSPELGAPVDVGSRVQRTMQDIQDPFMRETTPNQFVSPLASPPTRRETQLLLGKVTDHGQCRVKLFKQRKNQTNSFLNGLIRVKYHLAYWIVDQANGQTKAQLPLLRFRHLPSLQALAQPMEFGLGQAALEAKQQAIVMGSWVIDPLVINDQGIRQRTDFQQPVPVAARAGQARDLQAEHSPNVPQPHFGYQPLKAIAANDRGGRVPLILVYHLDTGGRPSQLPSPLDEIILSGLTADVFSNLEEGRLPHIDDGESVEMIRTDFWRRLPHEHRRPPFQYIHLQDGQPPHSTRARQAAQPHEFADQRRGQATPGPVSPEHHEKTGARTCTHLLAEHRPQQTRIPLSYLLISFLRIESLLLLDQLGYAPQSFKREQGRFCRTSIGFSYPGIIGQTRCNGPVIAIRHADDEIGVRSSTDPNELHALAMQG